MQENIQLIMSVKFLIGVELKAKPRMHFGAPDASWGGNVDYIDEMNKREEITLFQVKTLMCSSWQWGRGVVFVF